MFWDNKRTQLTVGAANRKDTLDRADECCVNFRFQKAKGHSAFGCLDSFIAYSSLTSGAEYGVRVELQVKL